jgi:hypothetical protein
MSPQNISHSRRIASTLTDLLLNSAIYCSTVCILLQGLNWQMQVEDCYDFEEERQQISLD